jgi:hypothetical protein
VTRADGDELMDLMRRYLEVRDLSIHYIQWVNTIPYSLKPTKVRSPKISVVKQALRSLAKRIGIKRAEFEQKLTAHLMRLKAGKPPTQALVALSDKVRRDLERKLHKMPPSPEKASVYFRAELERSASPDFSVYFFDELKHIDHPALQPTVDWFKGGVPGRSMSAASPLSSLDPGRETREQFSFYRFFEKYVPDKERDLLRDMEASFREFLTVAVSEWDLSKKPAIISPALEHIGEHLWLVSRSEGLTRALLPQIRPVLDRLPRWQSDDGSWPTDTMLVGTSGHGLIPSVHATALCTLVLQKLSDDRHDDAIRRAIDWLWQQDLGGSWGSFANGKEIPDLLTTVIVLEVLRRSGQSHEHVQIDRAENWVKTQQTQVGFWGERVSERDFLSATILEYFRDSQSYTPPQLSQFLQLSRDFLRKAEELNEEGGGASRRLAAVAAFHAVEFFLYGVMNDPLFGMSHFKPNRADETLGLRMALDNLERRLKDDGKLEPSRHMKHRAQLLQLGSVRDGIVHRGHDISNNLELLRAAKQFILTYSRELIDRDILR